MSEKIDDLIDQLEEYKKENPEDVDKAMSAVQGVFSRILEDDFKSAKEEIEQMSPQQNLAMANELFDQAEKESDDIKQILTTVGKVALKVGKIALL